MVEFDVLDLADGTLVLAHSDDCSSVTQGAGGPVSGLGSPSCASSRRSCRRSTRRSVPRRDPEVGLHVDLKRAGYEARGRRGAARHGVVARSLVSSGFARSLGVGSLEPRLRLGARVPARPPPAVSQRRLLAPACSRRSSRCARAPAPHRLLARPRRRDRARAALPRRHAGGGRALPRPRRRGVGLDGRRPRRAAGWRRAGVDGVIHERSRVPRRYPETVKRAGLGLLLRLRARRRAARVSCVATAEPSGDRPRRRPVRRRRPRRRRDDHHRHDDDRDDDDHDHAAAAASSADAAPEAAPEPD